MTAPNEPVRAFTEWMQGGKSTKAARVGAAEVVDECVRLRAMLRALSKVKISDGGGEAASATVTVTRGSDGLAVNVTVVCASQSEEALARAVQRAALEGVAKGAKLKGNVDDHFEMVTEEGRETGTRATEDGDG